MECKKRTGECLGAIKAEGSRGDGGDRSNWPGLLPQYSNSQSQREAETEPNSRRGSYKR